MASGSNGLSCLGRRFATFCPSLAFGLLWKLWRPYGAWSHQHRIAHAMERRQITFGTKRLTLPAVPPMVLIGRWLLWSLSHGQAICWSLFPRTCPLCVSSWTSLASKTGKLSQSSKIATTFVLTSWWSLKFDLLCQNDLLKCSLPVPCCRREPFGSDWPRILIFGIQIQDVTCALPGEAKGSSESDCLTALSVIKLLNCQGLQVLINLLDVQLCMCVWVLTLFMVYPTLDIRASGDLFFLETMRSEHRWNDKSPKAGSGDWTLWQRDAA